MFSKNEFVIVNNLIFIAEQILFSADTQLMCSAELGIKKVPGALF